ncbi:hypothetical protein [Lysobacter antibioticus]|uniref:hypothetical protein n=1 Tax=Lysobacter antibioticus TaxID=84531 RepID=UPI001269EBB4|nr:hypothetical protein [Lysobacter antibioticus]
MARLIPKVQFDTRTLGCAILCLGLVACGSPAEVSASASQTNGPASLSSPKAQPVKDTPNAPASAPKLSKKEFEEKLFALIHGIQGTSDLSKARVETLTHFALSANEVDGTWSTQGSLDSGSAYSFDFSQYASDDKRVGIHLPDEKRYDPQQRRPCVLALNGLHDKLKTMGYQYSEFPGPHNRPQAWQYWKGRQSLLVDYTYRPKPEDNEAACVYAVTIEMIIED